MDGNCQSMAAATFDEKDVTTKIKEILDTLTDPDIHNYVFEHCDIWIDMLAKAERASLYHENFKGGLLLHTYYVMKYVQDIHERLEYPEVANYDVLILSAFLHDIGKALKPEDTTEHPRVSAVFVEKHFRQFPQIYTRILLAVGNHMLSPLIGVSQQTTIETVLLHAADGYAAISGACVRPDIGAYHWCGVLTTMDDKACSKTVYPEYSWMLD